MQLLLFLSALLSGLTGAFAGDRAVEQSRIERLGDAAVQQAAEATQAISRPALSLGGQSFPALRAVATAFARPVAADRAPLRLIGIDTQRLE